MNSRYCLTFKSTFQTEKPKKLENYFFYVKIFYWNYLHLTAQTKETYFSSLKSMYVNTYLDWFLKSLYLFKNCLIHFLTLSLQLISDHCTTFHWYYNSSESADFKEKFVGRKRCFMNKAMFMDAALDAKKTNRDVLMTYHSTYITFQCT